MNCAKFPQRSFSNQNNVENDYFLLDVKKDLQGKIVFVWSMSKFNISHDQLRNLTSDCLNSLLRGEGKLKLPVLRNDYSLTDVTNDLK